MAAATLITATEADASRPASPLARQLVRFAVIGVGSTVLNLGLLALLHAPLGVQAANLVGLAVSTVANTAANRAWTFGVRGADGMARHHVQALAVFGLTWALSSGALVLLTALDPQASTVAAVLVVAVANLVSTVVRFAAMRTWIFRTGT
jgi:putative flippase GtrA